MKKLFFMLLAMPLLLASCSDDNLPNVEFNVQYAGCTNVDGTLYAVQGDTLAITSVSVTPLNSSHNAALAVVKYFWDGLPAGSTIVEPFAGAFLTQLYSVGPHFIQLQSNVLEEDCTPAIAVVQIPVVIVASPDDIPAGGSTVGVLHPASTIGD